MLGKRKPLVVNVKEVQWSVILLELVKNSNIYVLSEYGRDKSELLITLENADVSLVDELDWSPLEIGPLGVELLPWSQNVAEHI